MYDQFLYERVVHDSEHKEKNVCKIHFTQQIFKNFMVL